MNFTARSTTTASETTYEIMHATFGHTQNPPLFKIHPKNSRTAYRSKVRGNSDSKQLKKVK